MSESSLPMPPPAATVLIPVLVTGAGTATVCTFAALMTGMNTLFKVAGLLALACLIACICVTEYAEYVRSSDSEDARRDRRAYRDQILAAIEARLS